MLITAEEYAANLHGYAVVDCVVRRRDMFYFVAREAGAGDEPVVDSGLGARAAKTRVVVCMRDDGAGKRWSHAELDGMNGLLAGASAQPLSQFVGVDADGDVYVLGSGQHRMETQIPAGPEGPRRGRVQRVRMIAGDTYVVGSKRGLARRIGVDQWESRCPPVGAVPRSAGEDYRLTRNWGFADADGFAADDLYAAGGTADLWHFGAGAWRQIPISAPLRFQSVCCGGDGVVYLGAQSGMLIAGRGDDWRVLDAGSARKPFRDLVWHAGSLYGCNEHGLWRLQGARMQAVELPPELATGAGRLSAHDGVLLMAGLHAAGCLESDRWNLLFHAGIAASRPSAVPAATARKPATRTPRRAAGSVPALSDLRWPVALAAYRAALDAARHALVPSAPAWQLEQLNMLFACRQSPRDAEYVIAGIEAELDIEVSGPLRALWRDHGAFALFDGSGWDSVEIHPATRLRGAGGSGSNLFDVLCEHASQWEFQRGLTAAQAANLRESYWVFGLVRLDDSDCDLLVFDRKGRIGSVQYRHDWAHFNGEAWAAEFLPLLEGHMRVVDLDAELCARIATCTEKLLRWTPD